MPPTSLMHRIRFISVGRIKTSWIAEGCTLYADRINHYCNFDRTVVAAGEPKEESANLIKIVEKSEGHIVLLDERGKEFSSQEFAGWLKKKSDVGEPVTFIVGGAYGVSDEFRSMADETFALSKMTLPHELCQLLFLEQLYRGYSIIKGSGYHH